MRDPSRTEDSISDEKPALAARVAELERTLATLKSENDRLQLVARGSREGLWDWPDLNEERQWWSPGFFQLLGYEDNAFPPTLERFAELLHPDDRLIQMAAIEGLLERDEPFESEYRMKNRSGDYRWLRARGSVFRDEQGIPIRMAGSVQDITDQKRAECALRESEHRYRTLVETATDAIFVADANTGELLDANRRAEELVGRPRETFIGQHQSILHPPEEEAYARKQFENAVEKQERFFSNIRVQHSDGRIIPVEVSSGGAMVLDERRVHIGIFRDVTARTQAEDALRASEAILNETGMIARIGGWEHDLETGQAVWTRALYDIVEVEGDPLPGPDTHLDYYPPEDRAVLKRAYEQARTTGEPFDLQLRCHTARGRCFWARVIGRPVFREGTCVRMQGTFQDITARVQAEERSREVEEQLVQAQKMEAVGTLAAGVAHDFNNALTAIQGYADKAIRTLPDDHAVIQDVRGVMAAAEQAAKVTRSLLTFSRKAPFQMTPVNLGQLVEDSTHLLARVLPAAVEMGVEIDDPGHTWIEGDAVQLSQVLMNLVVNARDAMPEGGRLRLSVKPETEESATNPEKPATIPDRVLLRVEDEGFGMATDVLRRVCDPFFTTKERGQGTGLGMAVVHGIVDAHHATMHITSEKGKGTRVAITFPGRKPTTDKKAAARPKEKPARRGGHLLVAEDNEAVRSVMAQSLAASGYIVTEAVDGAQAMQRFEELGPALDLAILDVDMPQLGGKACLARIQAKRPGFPVILVSGFYESGADAGVTTTDCVVFLPKPFALADLRYQVSELLAK